MIKDAVSASGGHNPDGKIACGTVNKTLDMYESTEDRYITKKVVEYLKQDGKKAYDCTVDNGTDQDDVLDKLAEKHNAKGSEWDISIHFNDVKNKDYIGDGDTVGTEVWYYSKSKYASEIKKRASLISSNIAKIGFEDRGAKSSTGLRFLKDTNGKAMIIEVCFCSDKDDVALYKANRDKVARAIADGIQGKVYNLKEEGDDEVKLMITYLGDADLFAAVMVAQKNKAPLMKVSDFKSSCIKAEKVIQIGGNAADTDRYATFKNAAKLL